MITLKILTNLKYNQKWTKNKGKERLIIQINKEMLGAFVFLKKKLVFYGKYLS